MIGPLEGPRRLRQTAARIAMAGALVSAAAGACAHPGMPIRDHDCPTGALADARRRQALEQILRELPIAASDRTGSAAICFQSGRGRGVISPPWIFLDTLLPDRELAAQLMHLRVHERDGLGSGCAAGLEAARRSEERATAMEARVRMQLNLPSGPSAQAAWQDYQQRCARPADQPPHATRDEADR